MSLTLAADDPGPWPARLIERPRSNPLWLTAQGFFPPSNKSLGPPEPHVLTGRKGVLLPHVMDTSEFDMKGWCNDIESHSQKTEVFEKTSIIAFGAMLIGAVQPTKPVARRRTVLQNLKFIM